MLGPSGRQYAQDGHIAKRGMRQPEADTIRSIKERLQAYLVGWPRPAEAAIWQQANGPCHTVLSTVALAGRDGGLSGQNRGNGSGLCPFGIPPGWSRGPKRHRPPATHGAYIRHQVLRRAYALDFWPEA
jgi:hypothetical protein